MTTIRVEKTENYSVIANACIEDERLTWQARGLLVYLLSKPNDWQVRVAELIAQSPAGRDAVYSTIRELTTHGYIESHREQRADGRFGGVSYIVRELPTGLRSPLAIPLKNPPHTGYPDTVKPLSMQTASGLAVSGATVSGRTASGQARRVLSTEGNQILKERNTGAIDDFDRRRRSDARSAVMAAPDESVGVEVTTDDLASIPDNSPSVGSPRADQPVACDRSSGTRQQVDRVQTIHPTLKEWYDKYPAHRRCSIAEMARLSPVIKQAAGGPKPPTRSVLLAALRAQCESDDWQSDGGKWVPSMRRYITERRWEHAAGANTNPWKRDGHVYPIFVPGKGLTWPPGYRVPPGAVNLSHVLNTNGELHRQPHLVSRTPRERAQSHSKRCSGFLLGSWSLFFCSGKGEA